MKDLNDMRILIEHILCHMGNLSQFLRHGKYESALSELSVLSLRMSILSDKLRWQPIATVPVNKTVALLCAYRHMSDDLLGCGKDIGYLTDGGWFSTCRELRAMPRDAFTHWGEIPPDLPTGAPIGS